MADAAVSQSLVSRNVWQQGFTWPLLEDLVFDQYAVPKSTTEQGQRGKEVVFRYIDDLPPAKLPIDEFVGPEAKVATWHTDSARMQEYGNTTVYSALAQYTASDLPPDEMTATWLGRNAAVSMDEIALDALYASGTTPLYAGGTATSSATVTSSNTLKTADLEALYAKLRANRVPTFAGGNYKLFVSPYQLKDLRLESGVGSFRAPRENGGITGGEELRGHEIGSWAGFDLVESNKLNTNITGASGAKVTRSIALGSDGFVKVYSDHPDSPGAMPEIRIADPIDAMQRVFRVSWYGLFGYKVMRTAGIAYLETAGTAY